MCAHTLACTATRDETRKTLHPLKLAPHCGSGIGGSARRAARESAPHVPPRPSWRWSDLQACYLVSIIKVVLKITCVAQKNCLPARENFSEFRPPSIQERSEKVPKTRVFGPGFRFFAQDCVFSPKIGHFAWLAIMPFFVSFSTFFPRRNTHSFLEFSPGASGARAAFPPAGGGSARRGKFC